VYIYADDDGSAACHSAVFFSHNKLANSIFCHGLSAKRTRERRRSQMTTQKPYSGIRSSGVEFLAVHVRNKIQYVNLIHLDSLQYVFELRLLRESYIRMKEGSIVGPRRN
jgi:hypothetical protein